MALREVTQEMPERGLFFKFPAIGDKFAGLFVSYEEAEGQYGKQNLYTFKNPDGVWTIAANFNLHNTLSKLDLKPGVKLLIKHTSELPPSAVGKNAMKLFKVWVDDSPAKPAATEPEDIGF